ncbi:hypothetical protein AAFF_G00350460 [Aldrovandia affinis]|uniref:Uncharacterized protein n=1 Tax=Aldrovandia affinis TaxID=143900 RepID=A0AAD7R5Q3_9TELE|nr:hypothetical protein AAFF_G00350460 [Aldrovandia affinis]
MAAELTGSRVASPSCPLKNAPVNPSCAQTPIGQRASGRGGGGASDVTSVRQEQSGTWHASVHSSRTDTFLNGGGGFRAQRPVRRTLCPKRPAVGTAHLLTSLASRYLS